MRKIFLTLGWLGLVLLCHAQMENPVKWKFSVKKMTDKTYELHLQANIEEPWHIYSQDLSEGGIAFPTSISFVKNPLIELKGRPTELGKMIQKQEGTKGAILKYYEGQVDFVQVITVRSNAKIKLNGVIDFMACTDARCLPPATRSFIIVLNQ